MQGRPSPNQNRGYTQNQIIENQANDNGRDSRPAPQPVYAYQGAGYRSPSQPKQKQRPDQTIRLGKRRGWKTPLLALLCVAAIGFGGYWLLHNRQVETRNEALAPYADRFLPNVSVDSINLTGMTRAEAEAAVMGNIESRENSWSLALQYQGHTFTTLNYAVMGVHTDREQVRQLLDEAYAIGHTGDEDQRLRALEQASDQETAFYTTESEMTDANVDSVLNQIATYFEKSPRDARLISFEPDNNDPFVIQDDVSGSHLNTTAAKQEILRRAAAGDSGVFELTPEEVPAAITTADIRKQVTLLSEGITKIATTSPEGRNSNIRLSMEKINGTVLKSGQTFSFNSVVGRRTAEAGFVEAIEYLYGKEVPGVGGGVCQASTTVYLAAVTANLQITKRSPHSMKVSYTELGQDATVSGTRIDLEFKNNSGGTIYITAKMEYQPKTTKRYQCVVRIYGPSLGEGVRYQLRSETTDVLFPGDPVLMKDTAGTYVTYEDEMYQYQTGRDGYVIDTYLQRVENGQVTSETLISTDTYKAQPDGYYVGVTRRDDNYY